MVSKFTQFKFVLLLNLVAILSCDTIQARSASRNRGHLKKSGFTFPKECGANSLDTKHLASRNRTRIAYGSRIKSGDFPSYVFLEVYDNYDKRKSPEENHKDSSICAGTIISDNLIITSAHCTFRVGVNFRIYVFHGIQFRPLDHRSEGKIMEVEKVCVSKEWPTDWNHKTRPTHDVAILKTKGKFVFNKNLQPACFPSEAMQSGAKGLFVGMDFDVPIGHLEKFPMKRSKCIHEDEQNDSSLLCANARDNKPGGPCDGYTGGTLYGMIKGRQVAYGTFTYASQETCPVPSPSDQVMSDHFRMRDEILGLIKECNG